MAELIREEKRRSIRSARLGTGTLACARCDAPVALESITFPKPVISQAIIPDNKTDETKLADALGRLVRDDPTLKAHTDAEIRPAVEALQKQVSNDFRPARGVDAKLNFVGNAPPPDGTW